MINENEFQKIKRKANGNHVDNIKPRQPEWIDDGAKRDAVVMEKVLDLLEVPKEKRKKKIFAIAKDFIMDLAGRIEFDNEEKQEMVVNILLQIIRRVNIPYLSKLPTWLKRWIIARLVDGIWEVCKWAIAEISSREETGDANPVESSL